MCYMISYMYTYIHSESRDGEVVLRRLSNDEGNPVSVSVMCKCMQVEEGGHKFYQEYILLFWHLEATIQWSPQANLKAWWEGAFKRCAWEGTGVLSPCCSLELVVINKASNYKLVFSCAIWYHTCTRTYTCICTCMCAKHALRLGTPGRTLQSLWYLLRSKRGHYLTETLQPAFEMA